MSKIAEAFDGDTYNPARDQIRLTAQLDAVRKFLFRNRDWYTLDEIGKIVGAPSASVSARLRDLRKAKFGGYDIKRRVRFGHKGLNEYHLDFPAAHKAEPGLATALLAGLCVCVLFLGLMIGPALGHDSWISRQGLKNPANEWCCGDHDCGPFVSGSIIAVAGGYEINADFKVGDHIKHVRDLVPYSQALPSPDGTFWRCERPDGSTRCFFAPPPGS